MKLSKRQIKPINLPRNPACPPAALTCVILDKQVQRLRQKCHINPQRIFITKRSKEKKKKKKKAVTNKMMGSEPRPFFSVYFHQTSTNAGFD